MATAIVPISDFRQDLAAEFMAGRNELTLLAYRADLEDFCRFLGVEDIDAAARVLFTAGHGAANRKARSYKAHLAGRGLQAATINRRLAALRSLVQLARSFGIVDWSLEVRNEKSQTYRDTRGPGRQGFRALLAEATNDRDRSILRLLHDLGLRRCEVTRLDLADVDLEAGFIWVLGKGRTAKERLTLPEPTKQALAAWIAKRGAEPGPLFTNFDKAKKGSGRLTGTGLWYMVRNLGRKGGLTVRPHGLRHSGITEALDLTNGNVRAVQKFSRHRDLRILTMYDDNRLDLAGDVAKLVADNS